MPASTRPDVHGQVQSTSLNGDKIPRKLQPPIARPGFSGTSAQSALNASTRQRHTVLQLCSEFSDPMRYEVESLKRDGQELSRQAEQLKETHEDFERATVAGCISDTVLTSEVQAYN